MNFPCVISLNAHTSCDASTMTIPLSQMGNPSTVVVPPKLQARRDQAGIWSQTTRPVFVTMSSRINEWGAEERLRRWKGQ